VGTEEALLERLHCLFPYQDFDGADDYISTMYNSFEVRRQPRMYAAPWHMRRRLYRAIFIRMEVRQGIR
jgi:hypothetical protein